MAKVWAEGVRSEGMCPLTCGNSRPRRTRTDNPRIADPGIAASCNEPLNQLLTWELSRRAAVNLPRDFAASCIQSGGEKGGRAEVSLTPTCQNDTDPENLFEFTIDSGHMPIQNGRRCEGGEFNRGNFRCLRLTLLARSGLSCDGCETSSACQVETWRSASVLPRAPFLVGRPGSVGPASCALKCGELSAYGLFFAGSGQADCQSMSACSWLMPGSVLRARSTYGC